MKKTILILLLAIGAVSIGNAQVKLKGLKGASAKFYYTTSGYSVSAGYKMQLSKKWAIEPSLQYTRALPDISSVKVDRGEIRVNGFYELYNFKTFYLNAYASPMLTVYQSTSNIEVENHLKPIEIGAPGLALGAELETHVLPFITSSIGVGQRATYSGKAGMHYQPELYLSLTFMLNGINWDDFY